MQPPKRRPTASITSAAAPTGAVRLGFSGEAKAVFEKLPVKVQDGLRRKLLAFGANPAIGKPLVGALRGYHRVTYGRVRSIAEVLAADVIAKVAAGIVVVHVLHIGLRKEGSANDPYEVAALEALKAGDPDAIALLETLVRQAIQGEQAPEGEED
jgi:hypothetical protein